MFRSILRCFALLAGALLVFPALLWADGRVARTNARETFAEISASKSLGSKSAPITLEVFSDYECPSCRAFYEETLRPMTDDYVASGKVYLIHRDFPLPMHKYARQAARWANAAARIGKFEAVDAALFDNQAAWAQDGNIAKYVSAVLTPAEMRRVERLMAGCGDTAEGIKPARLIHGQSGHGCALDAAIEHDIALGNLLPVRATPTYVVTYRGRMYPPTSGIISWSILKQFFDQLLSQR